MNKTILSVSDKPEIIESLRSLLEPHYRFLEAPDIKESSIKIDSETVNVAIIDVKISNEFGPGMYKEYITALMEKDILVHLLVEEKETSEEVAHLIEISDDFSIKPLKLDELSSRIKSLFHLKEVEEKVLKQYEKIHLLGDRLFDRKNKIKYETDLIKELWDSVLEMQERMHRKNRELIESERRYRNLIENSPDVIFSLFGKDGTITSLNPAFEKITGWSCSEWLGRSFSGIVHPDDLPLAIEKFQQVLQGETHATFELRILSKSGGYLIGEFSLISSIKNEKAVEIFGLARDITERKRFEEKLKIASDEWRITFDSATDLIILLDREMKIIKTNLATTKFLHMPFKEILGKNFFQLFYGTDRPPASCPVEKMKRTKRHEEAEVYLSERGIWVIVSVDPIFDDKGNLTGSVHIIRDITERKRAEEELKSSRKQLRALSARLAEVEEAERKHLARELHDKVGQNLSVLGINLNIIRSQMPKEAADLICSRIDDSLSLIEQTTLHIRDVMADLRPELLDDYGLMAALRLYAERFSVRTGITIKIFGKELIPRLPSAVETILFRIAQEALTNVAKHARASKVTVTLEEVAGMVQLTLVDDGKGFDPVAFSLPGEPLGWGLITMKERAIALGGHLRIESAPGKGTTIIVEMKR